MNNYAQANPFKRLAALVYDSLLVLALSFCYGWAVLMIKYKWLDIPLPENGRAQLGGISALGLALLIAGFYCFFWHRGGQTLGMKAWRIRLLDEYGEPVSWKRCALRCLMAPISLTIGYLWVIVDSDNRCLQDRLSRTQVVALKKEKKK